MPNLFPDAKAENLVIMVKQRWPGNGQLAIMVDQIPELQTDGGTQCFPLYLYEEEQPAKQQKQASLFDEPKAKKAKRKKQDAITDEGLQEFQQAYPGEILCKEDVSITSMACFILLNTGSGLKTIWLRSFPVSHASRPSLTSGHLAKRAATWPTCI